ncbi:uncharacterized protein MELLADRAFT_65314 [Melampsora larici-populina 98AG31]|uniref:Uncharacterized protein n=1 Tax=Melampsora larici-populina (strain 98AG31 / pathotype 3-4-7) TaxID=747676 RepID=F4RUW0_MELLP|nr:uncharacterized protein MELLADRAFT_65314 [Melampsora larici-populina 98AG31]EGG03853.1 hypothetical protein MELLADRAFT_65314 [Melampsora larici-populina 98AG31]
MWLEDQTAQLTKPGSHLPGDHHSVMPYKHSMFGAFPYSFPTYDPLGSGSSDLHHHVREAPTHSSEIFHGSGSSSVQEFSTSEPSAEDMESLTEDQHQSIIDLQSVESHHIQTPSVPGDTGVSKEYNGGEEKSDPIREKNVDVIPPKVHKAHNAVRDGVSLLTRSGKHQIWGSLPFRKEIEIWFKPLKAKLIQRVLKENKLNGLKSRDIQRVLVRAKNKLTPTFFGALIANYHYIGDERNQKLLREGWEYLQSYMTNWEHADFDIVHECKHAGRVDNRVWEWTSDEVLGYLMWMDGRNGLSSKVLKKLISDWQFKQLNKL